MLKILPIKNKFVSLHREIETEGETERPLTYCENSHIRDKKQLKINSFINPLKHILLWHRMIL